MNCSPIATRLERTPIFFPRIRGPWYTCVVLSRVWLRLRSSADPHWQGVYRKGGQPLTPLTKRQGSPFYVTAMCTCLYFSAKALQTILVLAGPQDLYKRWADKSQDLNVEWNMDAAKEVLEAWQRSFTKVKFIFPNGRRTYSACKTRLILVNWAVTVLSFLRAFWWYGRWFDRRYTVIRVICVHTNRGW